MSPLANIAEDLAAGTVDITEAGARARAAVGPQRRTVSGLPRSVLLSTSEVEGMFLALNEYMKAYSIQDARRWTATFVSMEARLGVCQGHQECEAQVIAQLRALIERIVAVSGGRCPASCVPFAEAIVDCVLKHPASSDPADQARLLRTRAAFSACETAHSKHGGAVFAAVDECLRREGWSYHSDPSAQRFLIRFHFPFGTTTLGLYASPLRLLIVAVEVVRVRPDAFARERDWVTAEFPGIDTDFDAGRQTLSLQFNVDLRGQEVTATLVRDAIVYINGAAEALIMRSQV